MKTIDKKKVRLHLTNIAGLGAIRLTESLLPSLLQSPNYTVDKIYLPSHNKFFSILTGHDNQNLIPYKRYLPNAISRVLECTLFANAFNGDSPLLVLGDIPLRAKCFQTVFVQSPLLTSNSNSGRSIGFIKYWIARTLFKLNLKFVDSFIVQTEVMKTELINTYPAIKNQVYVIAQPAPKWLMKANLKRTGRISNDKKLNLFYPAASYPHKNHQLLSKIIPSNLSGWPIDEISLTLPEDLNPNKSIFWIHCVNHLTPDQVINIYRKTDALLFLSKAESFGFPLIEAMWVGLPIICPNLPYAHTLCGDQAFYFDPDDIDSLKTAILKLEEKLASGWWPNWTKNLENIPANWDEVAKIMLDISTSKVAQ